MPQEKDAASASDFSSPEEIEQEIARLRQELEDFQQQHEDTMIRVRELREMEIRERIPLAAEIFSSQQEKLRLEVEMEFRRKKINRLGLASDDSLF